MNEIIVLRTKPFSTLLYLILATCLIASCGSRSDIDRDDQTTPSVSVVPTVKLGTATFTPIPSPLPIVKLNIHLDDQNWYVQYENSKWEPYNLNEESTQLGLASRGIVGCKLFVPEHTAGPKSEPQEIQLGDVAYRVFHDMDSTVAVRQDWYLALHGVSPVGLGYAQVIAVQAGVDQWEACELAAQDVLATLNNPVDQTDYDEYPDELRGIPRLYPVTDLWPPANQPNLMFFEGSVGYDFFLTLIDPETRLVYDISSFFNFSDEHVKYDDAIIRIDGQPWSPDGNRFAIQIDYIKLYDLFGGEYQSFATDIYVVDLEEQSIEYVHTAPIPFFGIHWSPDGRYLLFIERDFEWTGEGSAFRLVHLDMFTGETQLLFHSTRRWSDGGPVPSNIDIVGWSPDGEWIALNVIQDLTIEHGTYLLKPDGQAEPRLINDKIASGWVRNAGQLWIWFIDEAAFPGYMGKTSSDSIHFINLAGGERILQENQFKKPYLSPSGNYAFLVDRDSSSDDFVQYCIQKVKNSISSCLIKEQVVPRPLKFNMWGHFWSYDDQMLAFPIGSVLAEGEFLEQIYLFDLDWQILSWGNVPFSGNGWWSPLTEQP
jgi:hypothetical protein